MARQILSTGIQDFRDLRESNCIYVDKTQLLYTLVTQGKMYFLSRPRRFGKSLIVSTLMELFKGSRELFTDLWIEDKWDWTKQFPVIHISFSSVSYKNQSLEVGIRQYLLKLFEDNKLEARAETDIGLLFANLIQQLHGKHGKVVILIDEYDKPLIDYLEFHKIEQAKENQEILANFYAGLKDCGGLIRLLFITGVSKFTKVSLFSKLNNLTDLTVSPKFATLTGYTREEVEHYFEDYIQETLSVLTDYNRVELLEKIRVWYNGYSWDGKTRMYNPYDILLFFFNQDFQSFWFGTGTPKFLVDRMLQQNFYQIEDIEADLNFLDEYSLDNLEITSLMFQGGYLTIKEKKEDGELLLSYPNQEVKDALQQIKTKKYAHTYAADSRIKIGIGINFNVANRELDGWKEEVL